MSQYGNLSADEKAKIAAKIDELGDRTGKSWNYEVMDRQGQAEVSPLLEISIDGKISQPVKLSPTEKPASEVISEVIENHAARHR